MKPFWPFKHQFDEKNLFSYGLIFFYMLRKKSFKIHSEKKKFLEFFIDLTVNNIRENKWVMGHPVEDHFPFPFLIYSRRAHFPMTAYLLHFLPVCMYIFHVLSILVPDSRALSSIFASLSLSLYIFISHTHSFKASNLRFLSLTLSLHLFFLLCICISSVFP